MRKRDVVIASSGAAALAFGVLAIGGVVRWGQAGTALLAAVGVIAVAFSQRTFDRRSPLLVLIGIAAGLTALQLVPLPGVVADLLIPTTSALRADGTDLAGVTAWQGATADAPATLTALIGFLTLLALAVIALRLSTSERGRYRIVAGVAALCGLVAAIAGVHRLFGLTALYGLYEPEFAHPILISPLLNGNTLACLMAVGAALAIGLAAHRRQPNWLRVLWLVVVGGCGAVVVETVSRGGTLALVAGSLVTIAVLVAQRLTGNESSRKRRARFLASALPIGILGGCLTVLIIWSNAGNVERQLEQLSFDEVHYSRSKFAAWRSSAVLIEESPWLGVGRGGFEPSFTRVHEASGLATYSHLENEYLQAVVDWGIPGALALALAALWLMYVALRRWRDGAVTAGVLGAFVVVAAQSNVDFGLEFLGIAAPMTALVATVTYVPLHQTKRPRLAMTVRLAHAAALVVGALLLLTNVTTPLDEDRRAIAKATSIERINASIARHPLDYYGYAVAAERTARAGDRRAIRLLNHAMALHPTHPQLHQMAARMLYTQNYRGQAAVEYAAALRTSPTQKALLGEILQRFPPEQAAEAIPTDHPAPAFVVHTLLELQHGDVARLWLARVLRLQPKASQSCQLMFELALAGDAGAAHIATEQCRDRLPDYQTRAALAKSLIARQSYGEAVQLLSDVETWQARREEKVDAWLILCDAQLARGNADEAKRCLRRLDASPDMLNERRTELLKRIEDINSHARAPLSGSGSAAP